MLGFRILFLPCGKHFAFQAQVSDITPIAPKVPSEIVAAQRFQRGNFPHFSPFDRAYHIDSILRFRRGGILPVPKLHFDVLPWQGGNHLFVGDPALSKTVHTGNPSPIGALKTEASLWRKGCRLRLVGWTFFHKPLIGAVCKVRLQNTPPFIWNCSTLTPRPFPFMGTGAALEDIPPFWPQK